MPPPPMPSWASPAPAAPPSIAPSPDDPSPAPPPCQTAYVPPFPPPLVWRAAYRGAGEQHHHCPSWSTFGPVRPNGKWHKGLDIAAPTGTPILATVDGRLRYARDPNGWGLYAEITFRQKTLDASGTCLEQEPMRFVYAHIIDDDPGLTVGPDRAVQAGQVIGRVGCSGNARGMCSPSPESHLHLTLQRTAGAREKVDALPIVGWTLLAPPPAAFAPPLLPCPS